ncbi:amidase [Novosphingobium sp. Gsoil 351]|uniref:amidase n=1 Tax=Novosphingobium sp. Gsoil 351 TaxID=2675225 RepID=UPI001E3291FF|nr:amidase [Novosphingobium sp. Gsoil 351]
MPRGSLFGVPVGIKDVVDVAGMPTTCHSRLRIGHNAVQDAPVVAALREAGAIIVGKLATHEFAIGGPSFDLPFPPARNPWNPAHHPGGSSSGAGAAVAAGLIPLAIGTDTAGSVRNPASACGIVGLKPTRGLLSTVGVVPLSWSLDHVGILGRSADDVRIALEALAPGSLGATTQLRIGYVRHFHTVDLPAEPEVAVALDRAAQALSAREAELPPLGEFSLVNRVILQAEGYAYHAHDLRNRPERFARRTRDALLPGEFVSSTDYLTARRLQATLTASVEARFAEFDVLLTASSMTPPCRIDDDAAIGSTYLSQARTPFNVTGHPALAMMAGLSSEGLPLSLQLVARCGEEAALLQVAERWERAMGGPLRPPID